MSEYVIGIHPGIAGALALVRRTGELIEVTEMPILRDGSAGRASVNAPLLAELLARWHAREVICEFVTARPGEGPTGAFSFGRCRGVTTQSFYEHLIALASAPPRKARARQTTSFQKRPRPRTPQELEGLRRGNEQRATAKRQREARTA